MQSFSLQSGSNGNSIYVEANGARLLFDAGISGRMAQGRMSVHRRDINDVDALIISHDHNDHIRCAGVYQRKFGLPIYITRKTHDAAERWCKMGVLSDVRYFQAGDVLEIDGVRVHTIPTAHDAVDGVGFVVECEQKRLGILTDLGHPFEGLQGVLESVDAAYLESNYDPEMLRRGGYPPALQARISGDGGHLSNGDAADLLRGCGRKRPRWVALAHLSEHNNCPELAIETQHNAVGNDYPVHIAHRDKVSSVLTV